MLVSFRIKSVLSSSGWKIHYVRGFRSVGIKGFVVAVGLVSAGVCRTLGSVQELFDAASRTKLWKRSHHY